MLSGLILKDAEGPDGASKTSTTPSSPRLRRPRPARPARDGTSCRSTRRTRRRCSVLARADWDPVESEADHGTFTVPLVAEDASVRSPRPPRVEGKAAKPAQVAASSYDQAVEIHVMKRARAAACSCLRVDALVTFRPLSGTDPDPPMTRAPSSPWHAACCCPSRHDELKGAADVVEELGGVRGSLGERDRAGSRPLSGAVLTVSQRGRIHALICSALASALRLDALLLAVDAALEALGVSRIEAEVLGVGVVEKQRAHRTFRLHHILDTHAPRTAAQPMPTWGWGVWRVWLASLASLGHP